MASNADVYLNFLNGQWKQGSAPDWDENRNPARPNDILGRSTRSVPADVTRAVDAAVVASQPWAKRSRASRAALLDKVAGIIKNRAEQFAKLITLEQGKNLTESRIEVSRAIGILEATANEAARGIGKVLPSESPDMLILTQRAPLGVVGVITTWTFPLSLPLSKIAPALLEGNTVVFKPSTLSPATAKLLVFTFEEAGIPAGVLNLVYGQGTIIGQAIVNDQRVKAVTFSGSVETARQIKMSAARRLIPTSIETSGKNSMIVCGDANLDQAAQIAVQSAFSGAGQSGMATQCVLVERQIHQAFVEKVAAITRQIKLNDGVLDPQAMGPLVDEKRYKAVLKTIETARADGAKLVCGGEPATAPGGGRYVTPSVFDEVNPTMSFLKEDVMGPVLSIIPVDNFEDAIKVVGSFEVGAPTASVYTSDMRRALQCAERLKGQVVFVNSAAQASEAQGAASTMRSVLGFFSDVKTIYLR